MPPALNRLLARPSALRALRSILSSTEPLSLESLPLRRCRHSHALSPASPPTDRQATFLENNGAEETVTSGSATAPLLGKSGSGDGSKLVNNGLLQEELYVGKANTEESGHSLHQTYGKDDATLPIEPHSRVISSSHLKRQPKTLTKSPKDYPDRSRASNGENNEGSSTKSTTSIRKFVSKPLERPFNPAGERVSTKSPWLNIDYESEVMKANISAGLEPARLVDRDTHRLDFEWWSQLLQHRKRIYGSKGVVDIWKGLRLREIDLPVKSRHAKYLWPMFLEEKSLLKEVVPYAVDLHRRTNSYYKGIMWKLLENHLSDDPAETMYWYLFLKRHGLVRLGSLRKFAATLQPREDVLEAFRIIYLDHPGEKIYDVLIGRLLKRNEYDLARQWHDFLSQRGDFVPLPEMVKIEPGWRSDFTTEAKAEMPTNLRPGNPNQKETGLELGGVHSFGVTSRNEPRKIGFAKSEHIEAEHDFTERNPELAKPQYPVRKQATGKMSEESEDLHHHGAKEVNDDLPVLRRGQSPKSTEDPAENSAEWSATPGFKDTQINEDEHVGLDLRDSTFFHSKQLSDSFCARLFATKAFAPSTVIKGLNILGAQSIGPLSIKELVRRTNGSSEVTEYLKEIVDAGICVRRCIFTQAVEKFAQQGHDRWLYDLADSSHHPDVFDDVNALHGFLSEYIRKDDWSQVERTLQILTLTDANPQQQSWNILLQHYCVTAPLGKVRTLVEEMHRRQIRLTSASLTAIHNCCLRPRARGKTPMSRQHRGYDLAFVINVFRVTGESGQVRLHPDRWREIIKRLGTTGSFRQLTRLLVYLVLWYKPRREPLFPALDRTASEATRNRGTWDGSGQDALRLIFNPGLVRSVVAWGFRYGLGPQQKGRNDVHLHKWARGIRTLRRLREMGVEVRDTDVKKELRIRFMILFGSGKLTSRPWGRYARHNNPYSLGEMVRQAEKVWGRPLWSSPKPLADAVEHRRRSGKRHRREHRKLDGPQRTMGEAGVGSHENKPGDEVATDEMIPVADTQTEIMRSLRALGVFKD